MKKHLQHIESMFGKLVKMAKFDENPEKMKKILEKTDKTGTALIIFATMYSCAKITNYLLEKKIRINNCDMKFSIPSFLNIEIAEKIIDYVNPKIVSCQGVSQFSLLKPQSVLKTKAEKFPNAIHVAVMDQNCSPECPTDCKSKMIAHYYKNGVYIERLQAIQVGNGAFGTLFGGKWHGQDAVFKFLRMNIANLYGLKKTNEFVADLEARLTEINKVPNSSNILKPIGHFRQQEQSQDETTGKYIADTSEVFVFKRCRMDLEQFRNKEYSKLDDSNCELLLFIMKQCLER